ncbi:hypothetical protein AB0M39_27290 [Streptomyces sp. NPDC051907]|uniref:hypothetical protein n=1 Tax=Streptomyces sp. NPDC051907 TaxID=3155284 RepID=UPI003440C80A
MSPTMEGGSATEGGPALFLGADTPCVALLRPDLDVDDPALRLAAEQAGVTPQEFAGELGVWQVVADRTDGEGRGFELPELADGEAADFADALLAALSGSGDAELELADDGVLVVAVVHAGDDRVSLTARVVPPAGGATEAESGPLRVELGTLPVAELRDHVAEFRRSLA